MNGHDFGVMLAACHGPSLTDAHVQHAVDLANHHRLHAVDWTEAYERIGYVSRRHLWDCIVGRSRTDRRRGPKDNPILVSKRRTRILESDAFKACNAAFPLRLAPERWVTWVVLETHTGALVLNIAIHPHPAVQNASRFSRRVRGHFRQMKKVERLVARKRREHGPDLHVTITGDVNSTDSWTAKYAPATVFTRLGLDAYWHGILAVAFDRRLQLLGVDEIHTDENGQDHPWLIATFKEKR